MQNNTAIYDVAIVGGGLAGLALSIQLAQKGYRVVLLEKETYPYHKVCGEYVSRESWGFLESLGVPLTHLSLPVITTLQLTAPNGNAFTTSLPLGGFGISRFLLDSTLATIAKQTGVTLLEGTKVQDVQYGNAAFQISFSSMHNGYGSVQALLACGAFGKRSNLDVKWKRPFVQQPASRINNYVGVKYHIRTDWPASVIGLHNFAGGYCGISRIEEDRYCLCYMTKAAPLKAYGHSIPAFEKAVLHQNPFLKRILTDSERLADFPVAISQISFDAKSRVEQEMLMLGDAAGMITPLCGNGMSMALHSSKMAAPLIHRFLQRQVSLPELQRYYQQQWDAAFKKRLQTGRILQRFFGSNTVSNAFVQTFKWMPFLAGAIIKKTHGRPY